MIIMTSLCITIDEYGTTYPPYVDPLFHIISLAIGGTIVKIADIMERKDKNIKIDETHSQIL